MKRSPMTPGTKPLARTPFRTKSPALEAKPAPGPRKRKCSNCGTPFQQDRIGQQVCSSACAQSFARRIKEQQERKADKARRQALKTRQDWLREAQKEFNKYIRLRDHLEPCISCGRFHDGSWDAGHYRSVGAQPALRFDENNVHKQCVPCNQHRGGNIVEYRIRLLLKIGRVAVEWLESEHPPLKLDIEAIQSIKLKYMRKWKELEKEMS